MSVINSVVITFIIALSSFAKADIYIPDAEYEALMQTYTSDKNYSDVCWLTSHNSFTYYGPLITSTFIPRNQYRNIKDQLQYGVRGFMVDLYYKNDDPKNTIILAHRAQPEPAIWNRRYFKQDFSSPFLETVEEWLRNNPQDIITIHLESYVKKYDKIKEAIDAAGLGKYLFDLCEYNGGEAQKGKAQCKWSDGKERRINELRWPTLGEMRKQGKNLVVFSDKTEDAGYGIMHVSNTMETQYDLSKFFICEKRSEGRAQNARIFVMNHFYKSRAMPGATVLFNYDKVNKYDGLILRVGACCFQEKRCPNFMAVDNIGSDGSADRQIVLAINNHIDKCRCIAQEFLSEENGEESGSSNNEIYDHDEL